MAVIINDMEVVIETPTPQAAPAAGAPQPQIPIRPVDILDVMSRRNRQEWRLLAH